MIAMKNILILLTLLSSVTLNVSAQDPNKKIYYLADTINISKPNRTVKIETISFFEHHFTFFCKCISPFKNYVRFSYIEKKGQPKADVLSKKPDHPYLSFKELMDIAAKQQQSITEAYDLYITEVLPGNKFRTNKVKFAIERLPTEDGVLVKDKQ